MARKPNYGFEKRKKETDRKAKKDAKREQRLQRRKEGTPPEPESGAGVPQEESPLGG